MEWLLIAWPNQETEPAKYWLSTLPAHTKLADLVRLAKHRWIIERDYQELKQELGLPSPLRFQYAKADFHAFVAERCEMISSLVNRLCDGEPRKAEDGPTWSASAN